jgi:hypothetical protein
MTIRHPYKMRMPSKTKLKNAAIAAKSATSRISSVPIEILTRHRLNNLRATHGVTMAR